MTRVDQQNGMALGCSQDDELSASPNKDGSCTNTWDGLGMGPEQSTSLSPLPDEKNHHPTNSHSRYHRRRDRLESNGSSIRNNYRQQLNVSQHTEIEFYSTDEGDVEEDDDDDDDDSSFYNSNDHDNNNNNTKNNNNNNNMKSIPTRAIQRATSRQSIQSAASDAYTLPVGAQDDVSSLEYDQHNLDDEDDDELGVDDISLKEVECGDGGNMADVDSSQKRCAKPIVEVDASEMVKSPLIERGTVDMPRLQAKWEAFSSSKKMLHMSLSSHMGLDYLPEVANEDDEHDENNNSKHDYHDDNNEDNNNSSNNNNHKKQQRDGNNDDKDEEQSIGHDDLLQLPSIKASSSHGNNSQDLADVTKRLHKSLFLPDARSFLVGSPNGTPQTQNRKQLLSNVDDDHSYYNYINNKASPRLQKRSGSINTVDDYGILARNLPPELDLKEARKYIIQLAECVPDTTTPSRNNPDESMMIPPQSNGKSSMIESSEYTEEVWDDDDDDVEVEEEEEVHGLYPHLPATPQGYKQGLIRHRPRESFQSYDYTEIFDDDDEKEDGEEEEFIEEEIVDEEEADYDDENVVEEVVYDEEQEDQEASPNAALGVAAGMVGGGAI